MKLIVTGASGFLGAAVTAAALRDGHDVIAVARREYSARLCKIERSDGGRLVRRVLDLTDSNAFEALLRDACPDVVVHSAWAGLTGAERDAFDQIDQMQACCRLVAAAAHAGVGKFIGIGSQAEYGMTGGRTDETTLPQPSTLYGAAKLSAGILGARISAAVGMDFAWLRLFAVYGPGDNDNWLIPATTAQLLRREQPRLTLGTQVVDYLHVDDAARAVLAVATTRGADGVFNLASGNAVTVRALVEQLRDLAAPGMRLDFGAVSFAPNQVMHIHGAIDRLCAATDWQPAIPLDVGLAQTVAMQRHSSGSGDIL